MIYGVSTDLVSLKRIVRLSKRLGMSLAERILGPKELLEFLRAGKPINCLAKRFAAREAFAKAVGTGICGMVTFRNVGVDHDVLGEPGFFYAIPLTQWLKGQDIAQVHSSMSDEEDAVSTFAVAEREAV